MNQTVKTIVFWSVILLSGVLLWQVVKAGGTGRKEMEISFSKFMQDVDHGDVNDITLIGTEVHGRYKNATGFQTIVPANYSDMITHLRDKGVEIVVKDNSGNGWSTYLLNLSPLILFAALWFLMIRQMQVQRGYRGASLARWRPATHAPPLSSIDQAGQASMQSPRLLLANSAGNLALGYCKSHDGEIVFYPEAQIGPVVAWMLAPSPPTDAHL